MYELETKNIGPKVFELMQEIDIFKPLSRDTRAILRRNADAMTYQIIVRRGSEGYYVSEYYKILDSMGLIEA